MRLLDWDVFVMLTPEVKGYGVCTFQPFFGDVDFEKAHVWLQEFLDSPLLEELVTLKTGAYLKNGKWRAVPLDEITAHGGN